MTMHQRGHPECRGDADVELFGRAVRRCWSGFMPPRGRAGFCVCGCGHMCIWGKGEGVRPLATRPQNAPVYVQVGTDLIGEFAHAF